MTSRLNSLSPELVRDMLAPESASDVRVLLTLTSPELAQPIRVADGFTQRLSESGADVIYGVRSRGLDFVFIPMVISLPTDLDSGTPRCQMTIHDVQRTLTPAIRTLSAPLTATIEVVSTTSPSVVEIEFPQFKLGAIQYSADQITADLTVESEAQEPFPAGLFTPVGFPGLF